MIVIVLHSLIIALILVELLNFGRREAVAVELIRSLHEPQLAHAVNLIRELTGGLTVVMWRKLAPWMHAIRQEQNQPSWAEWFQWLAEEMARDGAQKEGNPAYARYADWRPRE